MKQFKTKFLFPIILIIFLVLVVEGISLLSLKILDVYPNKTFMRVYKSYILTGPFKIRRFNNDFNEPVKTHPFFAYVMKSGDTNNHGFENIMDFPYQKQNENQVVIGIFGGSVAQQLAGYAQTIEARNTLKNKIPVLKNKEIVILNLALEGGRQPQQYFILSFFEQMFDFVINIEGENEFHLMPPKIFPVEFHPYLESLYPEVPLKTLGMKILMYKETLSIISEIFANSFLLKSHTGFIVWNSIKDYLINKEIFTYKLLEKKPIKKEFYKGLSDKEYAKKAIDAWARFVRLESKLLEKLNIPYAFFVQPTQYLPGSKILSKKERRFAFALSSLEQVKESYLKLNKMAKKFKSEKINYFSLSRVFKGNRKTIFVDSCCHINQEGNQIVWEKIVEIISENNLFNQLK